MLDCPRQGTPCSPTHRKSWPTLPHTERPPSSPRGSPPPPRPPGPGVILPSRDTWNYANAWNVRALRPFPYCTTPQWSLCGRKWSAGTITSTRARSAKLLPHRNIWQHWGKVTDNTTEVRVCTAPTGTAAHCATACEATCGCGTSTERPRSGGHRNRRTGQGYRTGDPPRRLSRAARSEEHTSELQSRFDLVCRLLLEKKKNNIMLSFISNKDTTHYVW